MGLLLPWPPGSALEAGVGMTSQLCGWLGVIHPYIQEQTAVAQQGGWKGGRPTLSSCYQICLSLFWFLCTTWKQMCSFPCCSVSDLHSGVTRGHGLAQAPPLPLWRNSLSPPPLPVPQGEVRGWGARLRVGRGSEAM